MQRLCGNGESNIGGIARGKEIGQVSRGWTLGISDTLRGVGLIKQQFDRVIHSETSSDTEFWYARELMPLLGYKRWENFDKAISRAIESCETNWIEVPDQFREVTKLIVAGKGAQKSVKDYMLTRYSCSLDKCALKYKAVLFSLPKFRSFRVSPTAMIYQSKVRGFMQKSFSPPALDKSSPVCGSRMGDQDVSRNLLK